MKNWRRPNIHEDVPMPDRDFRVYAFYHERDWPGLLYMPHWHEQVELVYVLEGGILADVNANRIHVRAGDILLCNSGELHGCSEIEPPLRLYCIIVDLNILGGRGLDKAEIQYIRPILDGGILFNNLFRDDAVAACIHAICDEMENRALGYELACKARIYELFTLLLRSQVARAATQGEQLARVRNNSRISGALALIDERYNEDLTIDDLAAHTFVSKYYLCRLFKRYLGQTFTEYLHAVRVGRAMVLLMESDEPIAGIALRVGYADANYFSRIFKKVAGVSPTRLRKQHPGKPGEKSTLAG